jgi:hypothetical protein
VRASHSDWKRAARSSSAEKRRLGGNLSIGKIKATLDKQHGLVGVGLPRNTAPNGKVRVPDRFFDNYQLGYAVWLTSEELFRYQQANVAALRAAIESANAKSKEPQRHLAILGVFGISRKANPVGAEILSYGQASSF